MFCRFRLVAGLGGHFAGSLGSDRQADRQTGGQTDKREAPPELLAGQLLVSGTFGTQDRRFLGRPLVGFETINYEPEPERRELDLSESELVLVPARALVRLAMKLVVVVVAAAAEASQPSAHLATVGQQWPPSGA